MGVHGLKSQHIVVIASTNDFSPANYLVNSFKKSGYELFVISDVKSVNSNFVANGAVNLEKILGKFQITPQLIVFVEGGEMGIFPTYFNRFPCPKFWWGIDTHNDYQKHLRISKLFDHSFIAQKSYVEMLKTDGIESVSWLPLAYPPSESKVFNRTIDISYVGSTNWSLYPKRGDLLQAISDEFPNSSIGSKSSKDMLKVYESSKVVFNHSLKNDINMRFFEAMGSGALLFTNEILVNGLEDLFVAEEDLVIYRDKGDLISKIRSILDNPGYLERIAKSGMGKVRTFHTYDNRAQEMLRTSRQSFPQHSEDHFAFSGALLSMGFLTDATSYFFTAANQEATGLRNRVILAIFRPYICLLLIGMRLIHKIVRLVGRIL